MPLSRLLQPHRTGQTALLLGALLPSLAGADGLAFSQAQADAGRALYRESCQICHGSTLANGQFGTPLKGSFFQDKWRGRSLGELLTFIYDKMAALAQGSRRSTLPGLSRPCGSSACFRLRINASSAGVREWYR